jgi:hypothetical protein
MPRYRFDLLEQETIVDGGGAEVTDDIAAMDVAEHILRHLREEQPELKNRHCAIVVSKEDGEEVFRMPLEIIH